MKKQKIVLASLVLTTLTLGIAGSTLAQKGPGGGQGGGRGGQNIDIERPDNFMEMTQEERQAFMQSQGIEAGRQRPETAGQNKVICDKSIEDY